MLKANYFVVFCQHVRSLLVRQDHVARPNSANGNTSSAEPVLDQDDFKEYVLQDMTALNALSSGHGSCL
ncbi:MAG: hypothetical protein P8L79_02650 [Rhodospirillaceae bacterium]|jgi:hypothetical protein|nr:hypothetical protein [Rhodospirillaceae bacterium]